jgi:hypothetical protein
MLFDELRLWGAYPKALYSFEELLLGNNEFFSSTYFPGMPLFQYFFAKTVGYFAESHLFLSYGIVGLSMLLPFTKKITWKKYWLIIPTIILTITLPMLFANSGFDCLYYYKTLFIDPMMGIAFGYALYLSTKDFKKDKFSYVLFCLLIVMPLLFKLIGLTLVCVVAFSYLVHQLFVYKTIDLKIKKGLFKSIIKLLIPFLAVIFVFFSWQLAASTQELKEGSAIATPSKEAVNVIINPTKEDKEFFKKYTTYIKDSKILVADNVLSKYYTVPNISIFIIIILIGLIISTKKEGRKSILVSIFSSALAIVGSLLFLYVTYSVVFHHTILCYERYISPLFSGLSIFLIYIIVNIDIKESKKSLYYFLISLLIMLFLLNFPKMTTFEYRPEVEKASNNFATEVVTSIPEEEKPAKLLTIYKKCDITDYSCVLWQHQLYLELLDDDILATGLFIADEYEAKKFLVGQSDAPAAFDIIT